MTRPTTPTLLLRRLIASLRWGAPVALLALLAGGLPALALARPPADPTVTLVNTGSGGLALLADRDGRPIVIGGSAARTDAGAALDRALPPWQRRLGLLLVPPPHAAYLPGALDLLDRRPVGRAGLLGLSTRPLPALDAWPARQRGEPVSGPAELRRRWSSAARSACCSSSARRRNWRRRGTRPAGCRPRPPPLSSKSRPRRCRRRCARRCW
jgi:hypothetical protein